jgi:hypothetical protein
VRCNLQELICTQLTQDSPQYYCFFGCYTRDKQGSVCISQVRSIINRSSFISQETCPRDEQMLLHEGAKRAGEKLSRFPEQTSPVFNTTTSEVNKEKRITGIWIYYKYITNSSCSNLSQVHNSCRTQTLRCVGCCAL